MEQSRRRYVRLQPFPFLNRLNSKNRLNLRYAPVMSSSPMQAAVHTGSARYKISNVVLSLGLSRHDEAHFFPRSRPSQPGSHAQCVIPLELIRRQYTYLILKKCSICANSNTLRSLCVERPIRDANRRRPSFVNLRCRHQLERRHDIRASRYHRLRSGGGAKHNPYAYQHPRNSHQFVW